MTREEAILCLKGIKNYGRDTFTEQSDWQNSLDIAIKALEQEPCEDAISRQAVIDGINSYFHDEYYQRTSIQDCRDCLIEDVIKKLPPVNPQPKTGKWIQTNEFFINQDGQFIYKFICSECKSLSYFRKSNKKAIGANVCPNCGCRMIESQESEE